MLRGRLHADTGHCRDEAGNVETTDSCHPALRNRVTSVVRRGAYGKVPFVIAVQTTTAQSRPWYVGLDPVPGFTKKALTEWADRVLAPGALLVADGLACFAVVAELVAGHERVVVGTSKNSDLGCFQWVTTLPGNLKNSIQGSNHGFKFDKYAASYLAEVQYRFNRRFDLPRIIPRLLRPCALMTARPEKWLRVAQSWG